MSAVGGTIQATLDSNIFISGIIWPRTLPGVAVDAWLNGQFRLISDSRLHAEVADVTTRPKFSRYRPSPERIAAVLSAMAGTEQAVPLVNLPIHCRDPKDDAVLACALGGRADFLVTGDSDLLTLDGAPELGSLRIVAARQFLVAIGLSVP